jgi:hypothetical protein
MTEELRWSEIAMFAFAQHFVRLTETKKTLADVLESARNCYRPMSHSIRPNGAMISEHSSYSAISNNPAVDHHPLDSLIESGYRFE